jgi:hypothetical protein
MAVVMMIICSPPVLAAMAATPIPTSQVVPGVAMDRTRPALLAVSVVMTHMETRVLLAAEALEYTILSSNMQHTDTVSAMTSMGWAQEGPSVKLRVAMNRAQTTISLLAHLEVLAVTIHMEIRALPAAAALEYVMSKPTINALMLAA